MADPGRFEPVFVFSEVRLTYMDETMPVLRDWSERWFVSGELGFEDVQGARLGAVKGRPGIYEASWGIANVMVFGGLRIQQRKSDDGDCRHVGSFGEYVVMLVVRGPKDLARAHKRKALGLLSLRSNPMMLMVSLMYQMPVIMTAQQLADEARAQGMLITAGAACS